MAEIMADESTDIQVLGLGFVGLPIACLLAKSGSRLHGVDIAEDVIEKLADGHSHLSEEGFQDLVDSSSSNITYSPFSKRIKDV